MAGYRYRIVTLRLGIEVEVVTRQEREAADRAFAEAVSKAQKSVNRQKLPRQVELRDGNMVLAMELVTTRW